MIALVDERLEAYARDHTTEVPALFEELREVTYAEMDLPQMQVGHIEGTFLKLLVQLSGARRILEVGMFTGYSALMMASGLPDDGTLVTCEVNPEAERIARRFFAKSEHGKKIDVRMGPALDTLRALDGPLDLVFLDADKERYPDYLDASVPLLSPGGLLVADNVLWSGQVADEAHQDAATNGLRTFNDRVAADPRLEAVMLTVRDGITLARKR